MLKPDPTHPCLGIFEAGRKSHRSRVYSDGRQHYCERCGEKLTHENFSNVSENYVTTHDAGDYNLPAWRPVQTRDTRTDMIPDPLALAKLFHDTYERLAPQYGYQTRLETRKFVPDTPNGKLMVATCAEILAALKGGGR
jgi:hypothetical protein